MNIPTLDGQFLGNLSETQKGFIWEYHHLLTSSSVFPEEEIQRLTQIWEQAQNDPILLQWLELIDHFYTNVADDDAILSSDRRAFVSEYIETFVTPKETSEVQEGESNKDDEHAIRNFVCPDGSGYASIAIRDLTPIEIEAMEQQLCRQCNFKLKDHFKQDRKPDNQEATS